MNTNTKEMPDGVTEVHFPDHFQGLHINISGSNYGPDSRQHYSIACMWKTEHAQWHVWLDHHGKVQRDAHGKATLYKNPLSGLNKGDVGYFQTRRLDLDAKCNFTTVREVLACVDIERAIAEHEAHSKRIADKRQQAQQDRERTERLNAAAPDLLRIVEMLDEWRQQGAASIHFSALMGAGGSEDETLAQAVKAAIAKLNGGK